MRILSISLIGLLSMFLVACGTPPISRGQADLIKPGETRELTIQRLGKSEPNVSHVFEYQNKRYLAEHYSLQTGTQQTGTVVCTPTCIYIPITVPILAPFVIVYREGEKTVLSSGTLEELSKSENSEVSGLMPHLKESHDKALAAKKAR